MSNSAILCDNVNGYETMNITDLQTEKLPSCSKCQKEMIRLGTKFRPPKQNNFKEWRKLQIIYDKYGNIFDHTLYEVEDRSHGDRLETENIFNYTEHGLLDANNKKLKYSSISGFTIKK